MQKLYEDNDEIVYLLPNQLHTDKLFNVRPFSNGYSDTEDEKVENLAHSIHELGQLDDVVITPDYKIIIGHRRVRAFLIENQYLNKNCRPLKRIRCRIDRSGEDLRRKAIHSNLQRESLSLTEQLYLITNLRREHPEWGLEQIAQYMTISASSVNNILKLESAGIVLQSKVHDGVISYTSALLIMRETTNPEVQALILDKARTGQLETETDKIVQQADQQKISKKRATRSLTALKDLSRIEAPAVRQAIREVRQVHTNGNLRDKRSPNAKRERAELLQGPAYLMRCEQHQDALHFLNYFVNDWATGAGTLEDLRKLWLLAIRQN